MDEDLAHETQLIRDRASAAEARPRAKTYSERLEALANPRWTWFRGPKNAIFRVVLRDGKYRRVYWKNKPGQPRPETAADIRYFTFDDHR